MDSGPPPLWTLLPFVTMLIAVALGPVLVPPLVGVESQSSDRLRRPGRPGLQGVPFAWTLRRWKPWLFLVGALLFVYWLWDQREWRREPAASALADRRLVEPLRVTGWINAVWLLGVVIAVLTLAAPLREVAIVLLGGLSLLTTPAGVRNANRFTIAPMLEVAAVFLGIFLTMIPALELLRARGAALGVSEPWQFFWATGALSAFLDNAPPTWPSSPSRRGPAARRGCRGDAPRARRHQPWGPCAWAPTLTSAMRRTSWCAPSPLYGAVALAFL